MASRQMSFADSDTGVGDLVRRLGDDSKRLMADEVRLAKLELREGMRTGARGAMWLAVAFGAAVVALAGLTVLLSTALGRLLGNYWAGTMLTGALELVVGWLLVRRGLATYREPDSLTLGETRSELAETARWIRRPGEGRPGDG
ncbi:MAG TPA: phage holin family protein [Gemmatimonadales bacterium]